MKQLVIYVMNFSDDGSRYYFKGIDELREFAISRLDCGWETDVTEADLQNDDEVLRFLREDYGERVNILMVVTEDDFNNKSKKRGATT